MIRSALLIGLPLILFSGCGGDPLGRQPVSGTISLDGAPVEKGAVSFQPAEPSAGGQPAVGSGAPIAGGKYALDRKAGLPAGKYRVTINAPKPGTGGAVVEGAMPGDPIAPPQEMIPADWNTGSQQFVEVKNSGPNEFNFDVKSKGK